MSPKVVRVAYALLGAMTVLSFGGPFLIGTILRGGASPVWPPDRPVEWAAFAGVTGLIVAALVGIALIWLENMKDLRAAKERARLAREAKAGVEADRGAP